MGWHNVTDAGGISLGITGMVIVFIGLNLVTLFIASVSKIIKRMGDTSGAGGHGKHDRMANRPKSGRMKVDLDPLEQAAIAYVVQAEFDRERTGGKHRISIRWDDSQKGWVLAGKMRTLFDRL